MLTQIALMYLILVGTFGVGFATRSGVFNTTVIALMFGTFMCSCIFA